MTTPSAEKLAEAMAAHAWQGNPTLCRCGWDSPQGWRATGESHAEHVAQALIASGAVRELQAAALRAFADTLGVNVGDEDDEWWRGYRQGQREALHAAVRAAAALSEEGFAIPIPAAEEENADALLLRTVLDLCDEWDAAIEPDGSTSIAPVRWMSAELRARVTRVIPPAEGSHDA